MLESDEEADRAETKPGGKVDAATTSITSAGGAGAAISAAASHPSKSVASVSASLSASVSTTTGAALTLSGDSDASEPDEIGCWSKDLQKTALEETTKEER